MNRENREIKLDEVLEELYALREQNEKLILENERLNRMKRALMLNNGRLTSERNDLQSQVDRLNSKLNNISLWDLSPEAQEEAGHLLARSLLGHRMTDEEVKIEEAEDNYVPYTAEDF